MVAGIAVAPQTAPAQRSHDQRARRGLARAGWWLSAPALIVIGAVTVFPIVFSIVLSLSNVNVTGAGFQIGGATGANYSEIMHAAVWRYALEFTVGYTVVTVFVEVVLGTLIALVAARLTKGRGLFMALLLLPWSMITVISAELWGYVYQGTYGVADALLQAVGLGHPLLLGTPTPAIISMMVADIWKTTPFVGIIVLAGLVMLPEDIFEAAQIDGASGWTTFWRITFPLLRPTLAIATLFRILQAFGLFDLPFVLTGGGPGTSTTSLALLGYKVMFEDVSFGPGAAIATTTTALVLAGCILFLRVFRAQVGAAKEA